MSTTAPRVWPARHSGGGRVRVQGNVILVLALVVAMLTSLVPHLISQNAQPGGWGAVSALVVVAAFVWVSYRAYVERPASLQLDERALSLVRGRRSDVVKLGGATLRLGKWTDPYRGVLGTILHLKGATSLALGVKDLVLEDAEYDAAASPDVDARLERQPFEELREALNARLRSAAKAPGYRNASGDAGGVSFELLVNRYAGRTTWRTMGVWVATITVLSVVGFKMDTWGISPSFGVLLVCSLLGLGFGATVVVANLHPASLRLRITKDEAVLEETKRGRVLGRCHPRELAASPLTHRPSQHHPGTLCSLQLEGLGDKTLQVGVFDGRFRWRNAPEERRAPDYLVGPAEWERLVAALDLSPRLLTDQPKRLR